MADEERRTRAARTPKRTEGDLAGPGEGAAPGPATTALTLIEHARDVLTVRRVFGEPIERGDVTVIPAANVRGGGGGGGGESPTGTGSGGGFGMSASPAGAYVIRDGSVRWEPALDLNRTILVGQIVAIVALLTLRSIVKAIAKRR